MEDNFHAYILIALLIIDCIALVTVVLLQEGKSNGLSGAISGGAEQLFVSKTTWHRFIFA